MAIPSIHESDIKSPIEVKTYVVVRYIQYKKKRRKNQLNQQVQSLLPHTEGKHYLLVQIKTLRALSDNSRLPSSLPLQYKVTYHSFISQSLYLQLVH